MIVLYIFLGFIALVLLIAAIVKKDYVEERKIVIDRPKPIVFDYIKNLKNQDDYGVWAQIDPSMNRIYKGTDGIAGFVSAWDSPNKKVGKGEQEITKVTEGQSLQTQLRFIKPFEGKADVTIATTAISDQQTEVSWSMKSSMKYPMNIMLLFMDMDAMIGRDFSTGLSNLKEILERH